VPTASLATTHLLLRCVTDVSEDGVQWGKALGLLDRCHGVLPTWFLCLRRSLQTCTTLDVMATLVHLRRMALGLPAWRGVSPRHEAAGGRVGESVRRVQSHRPRVGAASCRHLCVVSAVTPVHPLPDVPGPKVRCIDMRRLAESPSEAFSVDYRVYCVGVLDDHGSSTPPCGDAGAGAVKAAGADAEARHGAELPPRHRCDDGHRRSREHPAGRPRAGGEALVR
jgi:hypothetical protein